MTNGSMITALLCLPGMIYHRGHDFDANVGQRSAPGSTIVLSRVFHTPTIGNALSRLRRVPHAARFRVSAGSSTTVV